MWVNDGQLRTEDKGDPSDGGIREVRCNNPKVKNITAHKKGLLATHRGESSTIRIYTTRSN